MVGNRRLRRSTLVLVAVMVSAVFGSATAVAAELGDYRWERRPLLIFAPTERDPRLVETQRRVDATRCDFLARDMVLGVLVAQGRSTLDGQPVDAGQASRIAGQFGVDAGAFSVVLIGKDGGEKWRTSEVPDTTRIYDVVDGMPMRSREMNDGSRRC
ncbi:DUF4174 domain-containing protein [Mycobacterium yunnanensis]|uniref:DUF4174 domain-containing protein n=1 Tax=Mycobacterium yunnanensis TaxID=368477 RepID=A0A9X3BSV4_9MYCO|nr:DUF4174 domain-containing protein [Mycobacterium yunnanensis]MCV7420470.1 DUF4174 domain-containing protein [Mycobacterium yunnanensis]